MYYTVNVKQIYSSLIGLIIALALTACNSRLTPPATPEADSTPNSHPAAPNRILYTSLPRVCNCVLRFDHISIEQGLSQSSARVIFQDSRGFLWFGTEDGLNRYDGYTFKTYKPDPDDPTSLSGRWINSIVEDQNGVLWIATSLGGLNRYDPHTEQFTHFLHDDDNALTLSDNNVNVLYLDKNDRLWIGTRSGLDLFERTTGVFKHYVYSPSQQEESISGKNITAIYEDSRGRFWVGTSAGGLNKFNLQSNTFTSYQPDPGNPSTISNDYVSAIVEDNNALLWIGTHDGLNKFNPNSGIFERFLNSKNDNQTIVNNWVNTLHIDSTGNLWVGTMGGLDRLGKAGRRFTHYRNDPSFTQSLSTNNVIAIHEDRGGVLWFGTNGGGINKYDRQRDNFAYYRHEPDNPNSLSGNFIYSIYIDSDGYAWVGTSNEGLNRLTLSTNNVIHYQNSPLRPSSINSNEILSIHEDQDNMLWIGTGNGLDRFDRKSRSFSHFQHNPNDPNSLSANRIYKVFVDSTNAVWVGTASGLDRYDRGKGIFIHYSPQVGDPNSLSGPLVYSMIEDVEGNLWVGTLDNGLNKLDPKTGIFTHYRNDPNDKESLSNDSILSILQDTKGRIWVGTFGGGLNEYHPETDSFTYFLEKDGLPNGVVYGILEDSRSSLWVSTNFGLSRFYPETQTFQNFDMGDGLQSNEFNSGAFAKGKDGELYFGGINGLTVFQPEEITNNPYTPQVVLTSLTEDDQPLITKSSVETLQAVILQWPQNSLAFDFAALSYNEPGKNQYAYFLEEFDTGWHFIGTKRNGRYTNIPGGKYTLLLKAANSDGVWNETPTRIAITVIPPYWQTNWFRILVFFGSVVLVAGGVRLRTKTIQDRNRELERVVQERTQALEERGREMEALYKADEKILRNVSLNQVFQTLVDVSVDMLHTDRCVVFTWDEKQTKVIPRVSYGYTPATLKLLEFSKDEGIISEVFATGKPVIVPDLGPVALRYDVRIALKAEGIKSFVHLPIIVDHKVIAVLNLGFTKEMLVLAEDSVRLISALINRAAISIANMELFEQTKDLAVMEERNRLARDLHDSAKQKAFAALAQLGTARGILNGNGNSVSIHLNEAENLVSDVIQELTFLIQEIYPIALQEKGLATTLREHIFEWENRNDTKVQFSTHQERRLPLEIEQAIYRVTQEAMANVARHSHAHRVELSLVYNLDSIQLSLADDGQGFDIQAKPHGMGLRSIRERISSVHGTVQIQSAPGQGTRLIVQVPTKN